MLPGASRGAPNMPVVHLETECDQKEHVIISHRWVIQTRFAFTKKKTKSKLEALSYDYDLLFLNYEKLSNDCKKKIP